ncbi:DNA internalization-related competence protein ComEC/Rec2 [Pseudomonas sp. MWU16-30317]|uniref:DNA internalization-related competence protein ComEC/Rec2 n=1 Tax=Pseudomonas sp. MWU16-30317 TaxID=2878095 RepID=UPI001CFA2335|nr:DNA internalization-related competence protein ComEC/Rec2 [Pseudomonas sp. MWU16-30317]
MRPRMVAMAAGLLAIRWLPVLPSIWMVAVIALVGLALVYRRGHWLGFTLLGFAWACTSAQWALDDRLSPALDGRTLWVEGRVTGLPSSQNGTVRFQLEQLQSRRDVLPARLRVSWYNGPPVMSGERWRLAIKLKRPRGLINPGGNDFEAWLLARRIGALGSVKDGERLAPATGAWRDTVRQRLLAADAQGREGSLTALVLGDDSAVPRSDWQILQDTGTVHLMVISGQHVGLLAGLVYGLISLMARLGLWPQRLPWLPCACLLAFMAALSYGLLAGFQVPVRRACIMIGMVLLWRWRFRHLGLGLPLLVAVNGVLLVEPLASLQSGFWLSFTAVTILMLVFSGRLGGWPWWQTWTRAQWLIAVGLLPALVILGLPVSLSGPLANLLAVPWISLLVLPLALLGTVLLPAPALAQPVLWLAGGLLEGLFQWLAWMAQWLPAWQPLLVSGWHWALVCFGALMVLLPSGVPLRPMGVPLLLLALWPPPERIAHGRAQVWQLDVGQGLAVLVRTRGHTLLYDTGPRLGEMDAGERVVLPTLRKLGVERLDKLLISHAHLDHSGGAASLRRSLPVGEVIAGEADKTPGAQACTSGRQWQWDGVSFSLWRWPGARESNPSSCVLLVEANGERLLLSGDIDAAAERELVRTRPQLQAHWLQAPHHGSRTSSSMAFLQALQLRGVLIPRGYDNSFGHPHREVMARYAALGLEVHDTALHGAIHLPLGSFAGARGWRENRRFWRSPSGSTDD